ncbi:P-loop containing nucleoside triphosphate hydrolase protein [Xylariomycetidae sp. FL2044]|nr:P-loop containing nucleoside triphosphate hydrolase protein [Xylariomycetidae sp. FL2044]
MAVKRFRVSPASTGSPDEVQPFLADGERVNGGAPYGTTEPLIRAQDNDDDGSDSDEDEEEDSHMKDFRTKNLQESGGWWGYIKGFSILWPYLVPRHDRKVQFCIAVSLLCLVAERALNILVPRQLGIVADKVLGRETPYGDLVIWLLLSVLNSGSGVGLVQNLAKVPIKHFSYRQITNAAFAHVMGLSMDFHSERDSAEVLKAVEQGEALTELMDTVIMYVAPQAMDLFVAFWILYWKFSIYPALVIMASVVTFLSLEVTMSSWNTPSKRRFRKAEREQARVMHQAVQGWQTVSYFNMFSFERARFGNAVEKLLGEDRAWRNRDAWSEALLESLIPATFFSLACLVLYEVALGNASGGDFVFLAQYWEILMYPLKYLSDNYRSLLTDLIGAERLLELFRTKPTIVDHEFASDIGPVKGNVDFKNVSFSYDNQKLTLEGVNLSVRPGETIALVGETGAGKSSIMKLLLRFYDVTGGSIEVDGQDIRNVTLSSLRSAFGVVPQDPLLFNASILENLQYADPESTEAEVEDACRAAAIHDKIMTFPGGYQTNVGENGVKLSGGEVQRLAIARVFLKDPQILILDEATSAVDTHTETEIQKALDRLRTGRTTFIVAHRLSTVVGADRIIVLHEGKIVESGSHQELLSRNGRYKGLWTKQIAGVG